MDDLFLSEIRLEKPVPAEDYLAALPVVRHLRHTPLRFGGRVTLLVGENGVGKSTLVEAAAVGMGFNAEGGTRNFSFSTAETHSALYRYLNFVRGPYRPRDGFFLRAESFYNVASYVDAVDDGTLLRSYGGKSLHDQSHGESFLSLVRSRFGGRGFYILDEPEAALSPASQLELLAHIRRLERDGSQLLIATHSPILMTYPGAELLEISVEGVRKADYRDTAHYQLTRRMLENPARMYRLLFEENGE
ncbi:MAG: AAA family ATPase [Eubacteriales bacterium]|nr:AAA family ATPase [Eubacteriales bacterium]